MVLSMLPTLMVLSFNVEDVVVVADVSAVANFFFIPLKRRQKIGLSVFFLFIDRRREKNGFGQKEKVFDQQIISYLFLELKLF